MRWFRNLPVKWKLMLVMVLTSVIAVVLLSSALFFSGLVRLRHLVVHETAEMTAVIGGECAGALAAGDASAAQKKLSDLAARTTIEEACLFTADGRVLARYTRQDLTPRPPPPTRASGEYFVGDYLELSRQIEHGGKPVGMIHLRTDTHTKRDQIKSFVGVSIVVAAVMALVAVLVIANRLERFVFSSMRELVRVARGVTERKDFTLRAAKLGEDETGVLTDAFNQMLGIIQERDSDSRASQRGLEKGVQERTRQLEDSNARLKTEMAGRKQAEELQRRLAQFPEENPNPVLRIAADGALLYANAPAQAWLATLGSAAGQPLPVTVHELAADARRQSHVVETEIAANEGRVFWFTAVQPPGEDYVNLYGRDVTERKRAEKALAQLNAELEVRVQQRTAELSAEIAERKQAEEALRESEERYRAVLEDQTELISRYLQDGTFTFVNEVYCRFFGKTSQELVGSKWHPQAVADDLPMIEAKLRSLSPANPVVVIENRVYSGSGEVRWMQFVNRAFYDADGKLVETQAVGRDITERRRATEELRRYAEQLQTLSRLLVDAQETERRRIAHELHDEIGQTLTLLKLSLDTAADAPSEQARARLQDASRRTHELIAAVRNLSLELRPSMLDDFGLLPALLWLGDRFAGRTQVHIEHSGVEGQRFNPEVEIAAYRIAQEALTNIVRHADTGRATVRLQADAAMLEVEVEDGGRGFDTAAALAAGCSIGLHGMRERATALGGELRFVSAPGKGTRVMARLPLGKGKSDE